MWKYIKRYLPLAVIAGLFMVGEVLMDLVQPGIMSRIVDEGVLGLETGGAGTLVTRVTNDITQVQNFVSQFVRGMIRCSFLTLGSIPLCSCSTGNSGLLCCAFFPLSLE